MPDTIICPECGEVLVRLQIPAHLAYHWGSDPPERAKFPQARERYDKLAAFAREED